MQGYSGHQHVTMQEIDGSYVQYRSQCIEGVTFTCNGTQDNNCNDGDATIRQWQVAFYNFDNMASALLSVVEVAVMDNYMDDCAYFLMDATGITNCCADVELGVYETCVLGFTNLRCRY